MVELLTEIVERKDAYTIAKRKHLALFEEGVELGTDGSMSVNLYSVTRKVETNL